jgi:hypothetical protein
MPRDHDENETFGSGKMDTWPRAVTHHVKGDWTMQQNDITIAISGLLGLCTLLIPLIIWTLIATRRGITNSSYAIQQLEESIALSRRSVEIGAEALKQQEEMIELLREISNRLADSGDRLVDPGSYKSTQS